MRREPRRARHRDPARVEHDRLDIVDAREVVDHLLAQPGQGRCHAVAGAQRGADAAMTDDVGEYQLRRIGGDELVAAERVDLVTLRFP